MTFETAIAFVLNEEGGYSNDPRDPGGETNFGISKRAHPQVDIKNLTLEEAESIYRYLYWDPCRCESLPPKLALIVFDSAVNQGVGTAIKMLQASIGTIQDGIVGPATIERANGADENTIITRFITERVLRYTLSSSFLLYGRGWISRTMRVAML